MKIYPTNEILLSWCQCIPSNDIIFTNSDFMANKLSELSGSIKYKTSDINLLRTSLIWSLNNKSWYGHAFLTSKYFISLKKGSIENFFDYDTLSKIVREQYDLLALNLIHQDIFLKADKLPLKFGSHYWISSLYTSKLSTEDKIKVLKSWLLQNKLCEYKGIPLSSLELNIDCDLSLSLKPINSFNTRSGSNCYSFVAGFTENNINKYMNFWMHFPQFEKIIKTQGYKPKDDKIKITKNILVFYRNYEAVHAVFCVEKNIFAEKTGQDFHDPYRLVSYSDLIFEWKDCSYKVFEKQVS